MIRVFVLALVVVSQLSNGAWATKKATKIGKQTISNPQPIPGSANQSPHRDYLSRDEMSRLQRQAQVSPHFSPSHSPPSFGSFPLPHPVHPSPPMSFLNQYHHQPHMYYPVIMPPAACQPTPNYSTMHCRDGREIPISRVVHGPGGLVIYGAPDMAGRYPVLYQAKESSGMPSPGYPPFHSPASVLHPIPAFAPIPPHRVENNHPVNQPQQNIRQGAQAHPLSSKPSAHTPKLSSTALQASSFSPRAKSPETPERSLKNIHDQSQSPSSEPLSDEYSAKLFHLSPGSDLATENSGLLSQETRVFKVEEEENAEYLDEDEKIVVPAFDDDDELAPRFRFQPETGIFDFSDTEEEPQPDSEQNTPAEKPSRETVMALDWVFEHNPDFFKDYPEEVRQQVKAALAVLKEQYQIEDAALETSVPPTAAKRLDTILEGNEVESKTEDVKKSVSTDVEARKINPETEEPTHRVEFPKTEDQEVEAVNQDVKSDTVTKEVDIDNKNVLSPPFDEQESSAQNSRLARPQIQLQTLKARERKPRRKEKSLFEVIEAADMRHDAAEKKDDVSKHQLKKMRKRTNRKKIHRLKAIAEKKPTEAYPSSYDSQYSFKSAMDGSFDERDSSPNSLSGYRDSFEDFDQDSDGAISDTEGIETSEKLVVEELEKDEVKPEEEDLAPTQDSFEIASSANNNRLETLARKSFEFPSVSTHPRSDTPKLEVFPENKVAGEKEKKPVDTEVLHSDSDSIMSLNADDDQNGKLPEFSDSLKTTQAATADKASTTKFVPTEQDIENIRAIRKMKARLFAFAVEHNVEIDTRAADMFVVNLVNELAPGPSGDVHNYNEFLFAFRVFQIVLKDVEQKLVQVDAQLNVIQEKKDRYDAKYEEILRTAKTDQELRKRTVLNNEKLVKAIRLDVARAVRDAKKISRWVVTGPLIFKSEYEKLSNIFSEYLMPPDFDFAMDDARQAAMRLEVVCKFLVQHQGL